MSQMIAPLFIWLLLNLGFVISLIGAGYLIFPVLSSMLMLGYFVLTQKSSWFLNILLAIPTLVIIAPFIQMFPIALGLKILVGSSILTVLSFTLLLPIFGSFPRKGIWSLGFFLIAIGFFFKAHQSSGYVIGKAKPNSLLYVLDADKNKADWATYDVTLDEWTKRYLGENPNEAADLNSIKPYSKYKSEFTFMSKAEVKQVPKPTIEFLRDTIKGNQRMLKILITPNRKVNRYDVFKNKLLKINNLKANGVSSLDLKSNILKRRKNDEILMYYVVDNLPLELEFSIPKDQVLDMKFAESSFDLLNNPMFSVVKRKDWMIPTPFVLNDAVVIMQSIKPTQKRGAKMKDLTVPKKFYQKKTAEVKDTIQNINETN